MVGEYLSAVIVDTEETLYRNVFRLPGGHALLIQPGRVRKYRYWNVEPRELRYRTDEQYAEHFLEIFREAVRCRLRGLGPIGADLSGGLDSSSIVCVAQSLYRAGQSPGQGLETFSMVLPGSLSDESAYIDDVDRMWNLTTNRLSPVLPEAACYTEAIGRSFDFPDYPNCVDGNALRALARARGVRVNLTGQGGDERLNRSSYHYADLLRRLRIPSLIQEAWSDASRIGPTAAIAKVLSAGLVPLLPERARHGIRRLRGGNEKFFPWIDPHFARRIDLLERIHARPSGPTFTSLARQDVYNAAVHGTSVHVSEVEERLDSWLGLEGRHPFQDQRIVEFAVQLPESQRWRHGQQRFVLRQALRGLLPESIRQRTTKGDFNHTFEDAFRILGGSAMFDSLAVEAVGWVDGGRVRRMIQELQSNACIVGKKECISHNYPLWMVLGVDVWYKTMFLEPGCDQRGFAVLGT